MIKRGFTLVEIIVTIIILGIISSLAITGYNKTIEQARARDAIIQLRGLQSAIRIYQISHNGLPDSLTPLCDSYDAPGWCQETWINLHFGTRLDGGEGGGRMHWNFANRQPHTADTSKYNIRAHWQGGNSLNHENTGWAIQMTTACPDPCCWEVSTGCPLPVSSLPSCNGSVSVCP